MTYRNISESKKGIKLSGDCCIVCGWKKRDLKGNLMVEGAHVKPFEAGSESDKYDNIIGLCPNHHKEYDAGLFYIEPDDYCLIFKQDEEFNGKCVQQNVKHIKKEYLAYNKYISIK